MLASLRVEQQKPEEALQRLRASMQKWFPSLQRMLADADSQDSDEEEQKEVGEAEDLLDAQLPSFEFRFETAKLLIELDETTENAVQVCSLTKFFHQVFCLHVVVAFPCLHLCSVAALQLIM